MGAWKVAGIVPESTPINIGGINPWNFKWLKSGLPRVKLPHPQYPDQLHDMDIFKINADGKEIIFAATEVSAGIFSFYTLT